MLSTTDNTPLTVNNFTFKQQAIGISDQFKEFHTGISRPPFELNVSKNICLRFGSYYLTFQN